jgi:3',5'-cyclic AMP phosphodiesterase CpdA
MTDTLLSFVHVSDTHISHDPHYNHDGAMHTPMVGARSLVHQLNTLPFKPDFVLHTGDVVYDPDEDAYAAAREILSEIEAPVYYLPGNHDDPAMLQRLMLGAETILAPFDYEFEVNGVQILCMDSNREAPPWCGRVSDEQLAWLKERTSASDDRPLVVALHHPTLKMGAPFWDERMVMVNGEDFHRALLPARERLRGVFCGHIHQNTDIMRDGITYLSGPSIWYQMHNYPNQPESERDRFANPGFNVVTVTRDQTYVRRHTFIVDAGSITE